MKGRGAYTIQLWCGIRWGRAEGPLGEVDVVVVVAFEDVGEEGGFERGGDGGEVVLSFGGCAPGGAGSGGGGFFVTGKGAGGAFELGFRERGGLNGGDEVGGGIIAEEIHGGVFVVGHVHPVGGARSVPIQEGANALVDVRDFLGEGSAHGRDVGIHNSEGLPIGAEGFGHGLEPAIFQVGNFFLRGVIIGSVHAGGGKGNFGGGEQVVEDPGSAGGVQVGKMHAVLVDVEMAAFEAEEEVVNVSVHGDAQGVAGVVAHGGPKYVGIRGVNDRLLVQRFLKFGDGGGELFGVEVHLAKDQIAVEALGSGGTASAAWLDGIKGALGGGVHGFEGFGNGRGHCGSGCATCRGSGHGSGTLGEQGGGEKEGQEVGFHGERGERQKAK